MLLILTSVVLTLYLLLFVVFHFFGNRELYNKTRHIPGLRTFPLTGCGYLLLGDSRDLMKKLVRIGDSYPSPTRLVLGPLVKIVVKDPEHVKIVLYGSKTIQKDSIYDIIKPWLGNGIITTDCTVSFLPAICNLMVLFVLLIAD